MKTTSSNTIDVRINGSSPAMEVVISANIVIVLSSLALVDIEKAFWEAFKSAAAVALGKFLCLLDDALYAEKEAGVSVCRFIKRHFITSLGEVSFRYRQVKKGGKHFSLLLRFIGVEGKKIITEAAKEQPILASVVTSYRKALKICGCALSLFTLWSSVQKEGKAYRDRAERAIYYYREGEPEISASPSDFAVVMIDEIWIRGRRKKSWEKAKVARLAVVRKTDGGYVGEPMRVYASMEGQGKFLKKCRRFFDVFAGLSSISHIIVLTDGCPMGRQFCKFYPHTAVWQLDWWHLWNYVHKGCKFEPDLEKKIWDLLNVEKTDEALGILYAYREAMESMEGKLKESWSLVEGSSPLGVKSRVFWSSRQLDELKRLITYIENNLDGIYGVKSFVGKIPAENFIFGSGPLERLQAVMIGYRMKGQGKHWSVEGAENLVSLLCREWNGDEVEELIRAGLEGLLEWENLNRAGDDCADIPPFFPDAEERKRGMKYSPLPTSNVLPLRRGQVTEIYNTLKGISERKLISRVVDRAERGVAVFAE